MILTDRQQYIVEKALSFAKANLDELNEALAAVVEIKPEELEALHAPLASNPARIWLDWPNGGHIKRNE